MTELIAPVGHVDILERSPLRTPEDLQNHRLITYLTELRNCTPLEHPFGFDLASRLHSF